ncbi:MAG: 5-dehydro-4-deoxy-D-glucuronate isomerase [Chitinophagaceae bacterium]|nr:5-dehydro-4-deoxy-D-glucuronate isomerase [Chitinophagaceae bacterium]
MEARYQNSPAETATMDTQQLREHFLVPQLIQQGKLTLTYSHYDRMIVGGVMPTSPIQLPSPDQLKADFFLERRELGIINVGGDGRVVADGTTFNLRKLDCCYLGKGTKDVSFESLNASDPAKFYLLSAPAHQNYPTQLMVREDASPSDMGSIQTANQRTIYKYIHADGLKSCQLVMGLTILKEGSVWNTMPTHTHDRRMEAYFYFDVPDQHTVFHFMGQPQETRHLLISNYDAVLSPPWSIHSGCGTSNYSFIWGMAGENYVYTDMDAVAIKDLR